MQELRQSTSIIIKVGPVVNSTGITPVTNLTIDGADEAEILKNGTTATLAISGTLTAITNCDGWYNLTLASTDPSALGPMKLVIQDDSACLPVWMDFMVVTQEYYDTKYNSTGSFKASLTAATYTTVTSFHASVTGYSTFNPATTGVTLTSATYNTVTNFHASVTGYSTFDPAASGVTLGSATYTSVDDFKATGFSTFDPAATGVTLASVAYASIGAFHASVTGYSTFNAATDGVTLGSAAYASIGAFRATGFSTFDPATQGVTLTSATYTGADDFKADVSGTLKASLTSATYTSADDFKATGFSTFDPAATGVTLASAVYASIGAFKADLTSLNDISTADIIAAVSDGAYNLQAMMRIMFAALAGKVSGGSTTTISFRDSADTKDRIVATVDANGNRSAMTLDGT